MHNKTYSIGAGRNALYTRVTELTFKRYVISSVTRKPPSGGFFCMLHITATPYGVAVFYTFCDRKVVGRLVCGGFPQRQGRRRSGGKNRRLLLGRRVQKSLAFLVSIMRSENAKLLVCTYDFFHVRRMAKLPECVGIQRKTSNRNRLLVPFFWCRWRGSNPASGTQTGCNFEPVY